MKRYRNTETGYRYDKVIFFSVFSIVLLMVFIIMSANSFDFTPHPYVKCSGQICENPYYNIDDCTQTLKILWFIPLYTTNDCRTDCDWCQQEILTYGEYGEKPNAGFLLNNLAWISMIIILIGMVLNHFIHNKGLKFDIEIPITEKIIINRRKLNEWLKDNETDKDNK